MIRIVICISNGCNVWFIRSDLHKTQNTNRRLSLLRQPIRWVHFKGDASIGWRNKLTTCDSRFASYICRSGFKHKLVVTCEFKRELESSEFCSVQDSGVSYRGHYVLPLVLAIRRPLDTGSYQLPSSRQLIKDWGNEAQRYSFQR